MQVAARIDAAGFLIVDNVVSPAAIASARDALAGVRAAGLRNLLNVVPAMRALVDAANLRALLRDVVSADARIVRAILFDKSVGANWRVPWHQDLFVAAACAADVDGFTAWTTKHGVAHARAPRAVLEQMIAVRIHLDACTQDNGPVRVLPGTHRGGVLDGTGIDHLAHTVDEVACVARAGSALLMRPLLLHASSPARVPAHRRVVHLEIADCRLPAPLVWNDESGLG